MLSDCANCLNRFLGLCAEIGIPMTPEKTEGPAHVLTCAGTIVFNMHQGFLETKSFNA